MPVVRHTLPTLLLAAFIPCVIASVAEPAGISRTHRAPAVEQADFVLQAQGVQIYACKPRANYANAYQWSFVAPEATLTQSGASVGAHGAGPSWESTSDRSSVKGAVKQRQDGGAGNIPWLLLCGTSTEGEGKFAGVTSVQRVATKGESSPPRCATRQRSGRKCACRTPPTTSGASSRSATSGVPPPTESEEAADSLRAQEA